MARARTIQVECDRCHGIDLQPATDEVKTAPDLDLVFKGRRLTYSDLCPRCAETIETLISDMREWQRERAQKLIGPVIGPNEAPPTTVAPDYSPPKPHSQAASER